MRLPLLALTLAPQLAWADCVYTGAKRAYLECIYNAVLDNAYGLFNHDAALSDLGARVTAVEEDTVYLGDAMDALGPVLTALQSDLDAANLGISQVGSDIADLQAVDADLYDQIAGLSGGGGGSGSVVQTVVATSTATSSLNVTSYTEPSSAYRVTITPRYTNSKILVEYTFGMNTGLASNTIFHMQMVRDPGGANTAVGVGPANGSRDRATWVGRPGNGYDTNDQLQVNMRAVDTGFTVGVPVTYGFLYRRETGGSGTTYFNYSSADNATYGFSGVMTITATEIAP